MAELGVAGSAVGTASLGIQVCQGLLQYYNDWKSYDDDIAAICGSVNDLRDSFSMLSSTVARSNLDQEQECECTLPQSTWNFPFVRVRVLG